MQRRSIAKYATAGSYVLDAKWYKLEEVDNIAQPASLWPADGQGSKRPGLQDI
jgi:hypothetical protein